MKTNLIPKLLFAGALTALAAACGGGGSDIAAAGPGQLKLAVADAPVDGATAVVVQFTGVELTANGGNPVTINFAAPKSIDLLNQSGTASAVLFNQPIPAGSYGQIRLLVNADGTNPSSYIDLTGGGRKNLFVPSGAQTGLKLVSGFSVPSSGVVDYTIDFDLRKAITCPNGQTACTLKPALRLVDNTSVGNIQGTVSPTLVPNTCTSPAVYLYSGTVTTPADNNSTAPASDTNQPLASKAVVATTAQPFYYQFTFLQPGTYTLALTCNAASDNPDQADSTVTFSPIKSGISVTANSTTTANLP